MRLLRRCRKCGRWGLLCKEWKIVDRRIGRRDDRRRMGTRKHLFLAARRIFEDADMDAVSDLAKVALFFAKTGNRRMRGDDRRDPDLGTRCVLICGKCIDQMPPDTYRIIAA